MKIVTYNNVKQLIILISLILFACKPQKSTTFSVEEDTMAVQKIFEIFDSNPDRETKLNLYVDDVILMAPGEKTVKRKEDLAKNNPSGKVDMHHEIAWIQSYSDNVIVRTTNKGVFHPFNSNDSSQFITNNIIIFRRMDDGSLKMWQIIYNLAAPQTDL